MLETRSDSNNGPLGPEFAVVAASETWTSKQAPPSALTRPRATAFVICLLLGTLVGCNLLVRVQVPTPPPEAATLEPLSNAELLRFTIENLSEVEPGLLYRSAQPGRNLIKFLENRVNLRHVVTFRGNIRKEEREAVEEIGGTLTKLRMSTRRPPTVRQILEIIRITHLARSRRESVLFHCMAGADRTGAMVGVWRQLFQGVTDVDALNREAFLLRNMPAFVPMTRDTIRRFRPELFRPFVENPALLDDAEKVAELERRYFASQPLLSGLNQITEGPLQAGVAKLDLLPGLDRPIQMATYGPFPGSSDKARESVFARAVVLDNGETRIAIISCDLLIIDRELRQRVFEAVNHMGLALDDLLLAATHAHTSIGGYVRHAPSEIYIMGEFNKKIQTHLVHRIASAVGNALADARQATLGAGRTFVKGINLNRRLGDTVDEEVGVIKIADTDGKSIAAIVNFAAHPVLEADDQISPDFPGYLTKHLDEKFGFGLFLNGALGDLSPQVDPQTSKDRRAPEVAGRLAQSVEAAMSRISTEREVALGSMTSLVRLPPGNIRPIPDMLFPIEWLACHALDWPLHAELQSIRIGEVALLGASSEIGVRIGLQIKRRSPAAFPFMVTHANGYAGYALTPTGLTRGSLDPTSLAALNGPQHGPRVVEQACDLLAAQWGERLDADARLLSPAASERVTRQTEGQSAEIVLAARNAAMDEEEAAAHVRVDPTLPQTRRPQGFGQDSMEDLFRVEISQLFLDELRGGQRLDGRRHETRGTIDALLPNDFRLSVSGGFARTDWRDADGALDREEGFTDVETRLRRPFLLYGDKATGNALRISPQLGMVLPTGNDQPSVPYAFSPATGVWRPLVGLSLEWNWETARTLSIDSLFYTAMSRNHGRQPGEYFENSLRYSERLGLLSLLFDLTSTLQLQDRRRGGLTNVDVAERSHDLGLRPGLSLHLGEHVDLIGQFYLPVARSGDSALAAEGGRVGLIIGF